MVLGESMKNCPDRAFKPAHAAGRLLAPVLISLALMAGCDKASPDQAAAVQQQAEAQKQQAELQQQQLGIQKQFTESVNAADLAAVRTALSLYYNDHEGLYPENIEALVPQYLPLGIPFNRLEEHGKSNAVQNMSGEDFKAGRFTDAGGWAYVNTSADPMMLGRFVINCTHGSNINTLEGKPWTAL